MRVITRAPLSALAIMLVLLIPAVALAQHKNTQSGAKPDMTSEMSMMMNSPHHMLMKAHMKSMNEFATSLRDEAVMPQALDVEFARAAVAEIRHNFDAMEAIHQKHMETMTPEMKSKMQMMMEKMGKDRSMVKDLLGALESDVQAETPDSKQVAAHANGLLKQLGMISKMDDGNEGCKGEMKM